MVTQKAQSSTEEDIRNDLSGLAERISASIETGALDNECLQGGRVDGVTLVEIDGTNRLAVQTRVEEPFRILQLAPFGNVSLTAFLRASPMQTMPLWDQTGTPSGREGFFHFTSSITPGSAPLMRARS